MKKLKMASRKVDIEVRSAVDRNAQGILAQAMANVPIDTGDLWKTGNKDTLTNPYIGKVFFGGEGAPYAPYVEFGTGDGFSTDPSFVRYASQFKKGPGRNMAAQPYLTPAFIVYKKFFLRDMRKIAKNIGK